MTSSVAANTDFQDLKEGQWFYSKYREGWGSDSLCRVNRRKMEKKCLFGTERVYEVEYVVLNRPGPHNQTKMECQKAKLCQWRESVSLVWTTSYPGLRFVCHPGSYWSRKAEQLSLPSPEEAQEWETARKSTKWYFKIAHFFGCFANQKTRVKTFLQGESAHSPDWLKKLNGVDAKKEEVFYVDPEKEILV